MPTDFSDRLRATPAKPGVYIMRGRSGAVLYVGKAAKLRNRLRSYFAKKANHPSKIREMVKRVADFEYIVAESEQEALLLECNLIKQNKPTLQCASQGRQELPIHQGRSHRGLPAGLYHANGKAGRLPVLRTFRQREQRSQDPRSPEETLSVPVVYEDHYRQRSAPLP